MGVVFSLNPLNRPRAIVLTTGYESEIAVGYCMLCGDMNGGLAATVRSFCRLIDVNEYKRQQMAVGLRVTSKAFGTGRRMPIAQRWTR